MTALRIIAILALIPVFLIGWTVVGAISLSACIAKLGRSIWRWIRGQ